jgi:hypothetical protein
MVATERRMRAETEEELKELKQEKEALRSALRLIDGENTTLRGRPDLSPSGEKQIADMIVSFSKPSSRSSSLMAVRSRPTSLDLDSAPYSLPPSPTTKVSRPSFDEEDNHPTPIDTSSSVLSLEEKEEKEPQPTPTLTPRYRRVMLRTPETQDDNALMGSSPWADVTSNPPVSQLTRTTTTTLR